MLKKGLLVVFLLVLLMFFFNGVDVVSASCGDDCLWCIVSTLCDDCISCCSVYTAAACPDYCSGTSQIRGITVCTATPAKAPSAEAPPPTASTVSATQRDSWHVLSDDAMVVPETGPPGTELDHSHTLTLSAPTLIRGYIKVRLADDTAGCIFVRDFKVVINGQEYVLQAGNYVPICRGNPAEEDFGGSVMYSVDFGIVDPLLESVVIVTNNYVVDDTGTYPEQSGAEFNDEKYEIMWTSNPDADNDGDGKSVEDDCDDDDVTVYPNAKEACDGKLNDCDWGIGMDGCDCSGSIDSGCDDDDDYFCDVKRKVDLDWLEYCSKSDDVSIKYADGCCNNTLQWYRNATVGYSPTYDITKIYTKLSSLDIYKSSVFLGTVAKGTNPKYTPTDIMVHFIVRGNDCDDTDEYIYPGAEERCFYDNEEDDDCDDGTNIGIDAEGIALYKHWDNDDDTGINEGCEDDNVFDCEYSTIKVSGDRPLSGNYWIGLFEGAGACCGNNTYTTTTALPGYQKKTEFFPFWDPLMDDFPEQYKYSGCWDSMPIANNDVASTNLLLAYLYSTLDINQIIGLAEFYPEMEKISSTGLNFYDYSSGALEGALFITEVPVNVSFEEDYIFRVNMSLWGEEENDSIARLEYAELKAGDDSYTANWIQTGLEVGNRDGWRIKEFSYTPSSNEVLQVGLRVHVMGPADDVMVRGAKIYNPDSRKVVDVNGTFYGCDVPPDSFIKRQLDTYSTSKGFPAHLISSGHYFRHDDTAPSCPVAETHYCSYAEYWKENVDGIRENNLSRIPEEKQLMEASGYFESFYLEEDCCPTGYCWNGILCDNGYPGFVGVHLKNITIYNEETGEDEKRNYKCIDGGWQNTSLKPDQHNLTTGYCGQYQCFFDPPDGSASLCVNNGNYTFDDYCLEGVWTSRTSLIAMQLINLELDDGKHDYVLFCDSFENALNDYDYIDPFIGDVLEYLVGENKGTAEQPLFDCGLGEHGCVNNFCVIKYTDMQDNEKIVFGTSLNIPVNASEGTPEFFLSFIRLLGPDALLITPGEIHHDYCDGVIRQQKDYYLGCTHDFGGGDYIEGEEWDVWYNAKTNSIIYSPQKVDLQGHSLWESFVDFIKKPFTTIINYLVSMPREGLSRADYSFVRDIGKFRRLYIANDFVTGGLRKIMGFVEKVGYETAMVVDYQNIGADICRKVDDYNKKHMSDFDYEVCIYGAVHCPMTCEPRINVTGGIFTSSKTWGFRIESKSEEGIELWPDLTAKIRLQLPPDLGDQKLKLKPKPIIYLTEE